MVNIEDEVVRAALILFMKCSKVPSLYLISFESMHVHCASWFSIKFIAIIMHLHYLHFFILLLQIHSNFYNLHFHCRFSVFGVHFQCIGQECFSNVFGMYLITGLYETILIPFWEHSDTIMIVSWIHFLFILLPFYTILRPLWYKLVWIEYSLEVNINSIVL